MNLRNGPYYIVSLIDNWRSVAGGIQTFNRELCVAMALHLRRRGINDHKIVCLAKNCSDEDQREAASQDVILLKAETSTSDPSDHRILTYMTHQDLMDLNCVAVIGHSKFTGKADVALRDRYLAASEFNTDTPSPKKAAFFVHMDPEETENLKEAWNHLNEKKHQSIEAW